MASQSSTAPVAQAQAQPPHPPPAASVSTDARSSERGSRSKRRTRAPFRLCFTIPGVPGRSHLPPASLDGEQAVDIIAGKFYTREEEKIKLQLSKLLESENGVMSHRKVKVNKDKDVLESQRYGMYPTPLVPPPVGDRRLYFGKRTSDMVQIQCEIARTPAVGVSFKTKASKAVK